MKKIKSITINGKTFYADAGSRSIITIVNGVLFVEGEKIGCFPVGDSLNIDTGDSIEIPNITQLYAKDAMSAMIIKGNFCFSTDKYIEEGARKSFKIARAMVEAEKYFTKPKEDQNGKD